MSPAAPPTASRGRLSSTGAAVAGGVLVLVTLLVAVAFSRNEYLSQLNSELARSELQARVLEDHATRPVESVSMLLTSLSSQLEQQRREADTAHGAYVRLQDESSRNEQSLASLKQEMDRCAFGTPACGYHEYPRLAVPVSSSDTLVRPPLPR